jgi:4-amino-4-deoxy-L-arabinose transferase-like glycosyltransferase
MSDNPEQTADRPVPTADRGLLTAAARRRRLTTITFMLLCLAPIWFSLGDHPLYGRSDGRYASVSLEMANGGDWLVPHFNGRPHLTKPPLTYWLEAACLRVMGRCETAVRLPSAVAGSLMVIGLMALGWKLHGRRVGMLAAAVLAVMPLHVEVARLTLTDALLALFWFGTLAGGYLCVTEPARRRWPVLLWLCAALGLMTKGPVALVPVAVLLVWLGLAGRWGDMRRLRLLVGFPVSLVPLVAWAGAVLLLKRDAVDIWWHEVVARASGEGEHLHGEPIWFFVPVFLVGLFPATAMLSLPGLNYSWRSAWAALREGRTAALWALAVVLPFVMFSLIGGKLATYLLPVAPPLAMLTANTLERWLSGAPGSGDGPAEVAAGRVLTSGVRPPEVVAGLFLCVAGATVAAFVAVGLRVGAANLWWPAPAVLLVAAAAWLWRGWKQRPVSRAARLAAVWLVGVGCWLWAQEIEDALLAGGSTRDLVAKVYQRVGQSQLRFVTYHDNDPSLPFYSGGPAPQIQGRDEFIQHLNQAGRSLILLANFENWPGFEAREPDVASRFESVMTWRRPRDDQPKWIVLRGKPPPP